MLFACGFCGGSIEPMLPALAAFSAAALSSYAARIVNFVRYRRHIARSQEPGASAAAGAFLRLELSADGAPQFVPHSN